MKKVKGLSVILAAVMLSSCIFPQAGSVKAAEITGEESAEAPDAGNAAYAEAEQSEEITDDEEKLEDAAVHQKASATTDMTYISIGETCQETFSAESTEKYYWFDLEKSGRLTLSANATGLSRLQYYIDDIGGDRLWSKRSSSTGSEKKIKTNETIDLTAGTYYLSVISSGGDGEFSFSLSSEDAGESFKEENGGTDNDRGYANPVEFGQTYWGQLARNDNADYYEFTLSASSRLYLSARAQIKSLYLYLYDAGGKELWKKYASTDSAAKTLEADAEIDLTGGVYYLAVKSASATGPTGSYSFCLSCTDAKESFPETRGNLNNTLSSANAISSDTIYKGQIAANDARDFYKFTVNESSQVTLDATAAIPWVYYHIYDSKGKEVWKQGVSWNKTIGYSSLTKKHTLSKGTYYFAVAQYSNYTGNYAFKMHIHNYKTTTQKATTKKNGSIRKKCSCGHVVSLKTIYRPKKMTLSKTVYVYNGKKKKPSVKVTDSKGKVISRSNYKVYYSSGRKRVGKYKVTVKFKGKYKGRMSKTFRIKARKK